MFLGFLCVAPANPGGGGDVPPSTPQDGESRTTRRGSGPGSAVRPLPVVGAGPYRAPTGRRDDGSDLVKDVLIPEA